MTDQYENVVPIHNIPFNNPANGYWLIGDEENLVYSSKRGELVPVTDKEYVEWKKHKAPLRAGNVEDLRKFLVTMGVCNGDREHNG
jgi:hypothetical protein